MNRPPSSLSPESDDQRDRITSIKSIRRIRPRSFWFLMECTGHHDETMLSVVTEEVMVLAVVRVTSDLRDKECPDLEVADVVVIVRGCQHARLVYLLSTVQ